MMVSRGMAIQIIILIGVIMTFGKLSLFQTIGLLAIITWGMVFAFEDNDRVYIQNIRNIQQKYRILMLQRRISSLEKEPNSRYTQ